MNSNRFSGWPAWMLAIALLLVLLGSHEGGRFVRGLSTPCETPDMGNLSLPANTRVQSIAPDKHWVVYTESMNDPAASWRKRYWLAKLECLAQVNPSAVLDPTTPFDSVLGFSSDSSTLLFRADTPDYIDQLWAVPLGHSQDKRMIYADMFRSLEWSPDGRHVVIIPRDQGADLVGVDGSVERIIPDGTFKGKGGGVISWSPGGEQIVYVEDGDWAYGLTDSNKDQPAHVWITDIKSKGRRLLLATKGRAYLYPDWAPDGRTIALLGYNPDMGLGQVLLVTLDGQIAVSLDLATPPSSEKWSPDGKQLAIVYSDGQTVDEKHYLGVVNMPGGSLAKIQLDSNWGMDGWSDTNSIVSWSPDNREVVLQVSQIKGGVPAAVLVHIPVR